MNVISEAEIDFIANDLCSLGLTDQVLREQILDHIVCMLEHEEHVSTEYNFISSYQKLISDLGYKKVAGIQRQVLLAKNIPLQNLTRIQFMIAGMSTLLLIAWLYVKKSSHMFGIFAFTTSMLLFITALVPISWYIFCQKHQARKLRLLSCIGCILALITGSGILANYLDIRSGSVFLQSIFIFFFCISVPLFLIGSSHKKVPIRSLVYYNLFLLAVGAGLYHVYISSQP